MKHDQKSRNGIINTIHKALNDLDLRNMKVLVFPICKSFHWVSVVTVNPKAMFREYSDEEYYILELDIIEGRCIRVMVFRF